MVYPFIRMEGLKEAPSRNAAQIFERISILGDPIRCRILLLLEEQELAVAELCSVLQLPQSTVSRHLKTLNDDAWITARREGTSRRYSVCRQPHDLVTQQLWRLLRDEVASTSAAAQDRARLTGILDQRRTRSQEFFSTAAGEWAELRQELFGQRFDLEGLLAFVDETWVVGDLGCGTGQTTLALAPFVARVIAVDESPAMLEAARSRLAGIENVDLRQVRLEELPIEPDSLDAAMVVMVLHHLADPARVLAEAAKALRPKGKLLVLDMLSHDREDYHQQMGHVWLGFEPEQIQQWLDQAGFERLHLHRLRPDPQAKGPSLFSATARLAA
jgi:SAM-dependent methyltransferase